MPILDGTAEKGVNSSYTFAHRLRCRDEVGALPINQGGEADSAQIRLLEST